MALPNGRAGRVLAASLAVLLLAAIWIAIVMPLLGWYASRAEALSERETLVQRQAVLAGELPGLRQAAARLRGPTPADHAFLAGATDAIAGATLEQTLQAMTGRSGASLSSAQALTPEADGSYRRIQLRISVGGDWPALIGLLQEITTGRPSMLVDDLQVTATPVPGETAPISAVFTVIAFRNATTQQGNAASGISSATAP